MIVSNRSKDYKDLQKEQLSEKEKEQLLQEWKDYGRKSLAPATVNPPKSPLISKINGRTMEIQINQSNCTNKTVLNFATNDFLSMSSNEKVKQASRDALAKYGCGSCGPRGFYGTIDVHLQLEHAVAKFIGTDGAIMYSDGASTVSSTIAAFAKRGDLLIVDRGVSEPLTTGVTLSRANVKWFSHNDMDDLKRVLDDVQRTDKNLRREPSDQRRFIVAEGLYKNSGSIVKLNELVALKHKYKYRLILDESLSFGTLGKTGKGVLELFGKRHMYDAEIVTISLENAFGSIGGVTVGNEEVVDHQRLSGAGYCFSASSPPFTASAAIASLEQLQQCPELLQNLNRNIKYMHNALTSWTKNEHRVSVTSDERSPMIVLELNSGSAHEVAETCIHQGLALVAEMKPESLRLTMSASQTLGDIDKAVAILSDVVKKKCL
eukprot:CAMPEP_0202456848 /NCGR_PEP_ID=MMETSP1360-20130828/14013_1 /ASSEMBLY_ACC=CAM_ASM_000848 /TAXON_ID=515479 /ORGANISM="Licmophora paradoxa, Strain CCMP2313" /LENGTH=433 /DNA_ID=CAMNT_0049076783 /DNA_START=172 /DNA_END=1473 /DNA_ORIENTATION=+